MTHVSQQPNVPERE